MQTLFILDKRDYDLAWPRTVRDAARGVIWAGDAVVLVRSRKFGEYKFPGGGIGEGESPVDALIREVREETGLTVKPASIREYGKTEEVQRFGDPPYILEQNSYYYTCDVESHVSPTALQGYEIEYGYHMETVPLAEAIAVNRGLPPDACPFWVERDTAVMELLAKQTKP